MPGSTIQQGMARCPIPPTRHPCSRRSRPDSRGGESPACNFDRLKTPLHSRHRRPAIQRAVFGGSLDTICSKGSTVPARCAGQTGLLHPDFLIAKAALISLQSEFEHDDTSKYQVI